MEEIWRSFLSEDIGLPMVTSLITGILIGYEREVRGKAAGLRTHALVCFASTLVMLAAARQAEWFVELMPGGSVVTDPTRMAHGVLTGIGFLCAGVIFREGPSVHGLTTAASLWVTAALGLLYGVGMYWLALSGTLLTLAVLVVLRVFYFLLPRRYEVRLMVVVDPGAAAGGPAGLTATALRDMLAARGLPVTAVGQNAAGERRLELTTRTWLKREEEADALAEALGAAPGVVGFAIVPVQDDVAAEFADAARVASHGRAG